MSASLIIDLVALAIILGFAIYGLCRGFFSMIFGAISWILALLLTWKLYPIVAGWLTNWGLADVIEKFLAEKVHLDALRGISFDALSSLNVQEMLENAGITVSEEALQNMNGQALVDKLGGIAAILSATGVNLEGVDLSGLNGMGVMNNIQNGIVDNIFSQLNVPDFVKNWLLKNNTAEKYASIDVTNLGDYLTNSAGTIIVNVAAILLTFAVLAIVLRLICLFFKKLNDVPAVGAVNKVLGTVLGIGLGLMIIWVILFALSFLGVTDAYAQISETIEASRLCKLLDHINPFMAFLKSALSI